MNQSNIQPMISIGMPVYNGAKYIRDALNSLLTQTFTNFELIISDNASTDETGLICQEYARQDVRIIYFRQQNNIGAVANFQFVLNQAKSGFFMWVAHDDQWTKSYLMNASTQLNNVAIDFVFPSFLLKSIKLPLKKKINKDLFQFVESADRRQRVLQFLALHHHSHKCNIVYSLFRTEFLRTATEIQDIGNDGVLGAVLLGLGRGEMLKNALFIKRYIKFWPGAFNFIVSFFHKKKSLEFEAAKKSALYKLGSLFPEYINVINVVFDHYFPCSHEKDYQIYSIDIEDNNGKR